MIYVPTVTEEKLEDVLNKSKDMKPVNTAALNVEVDEEELF